MRDMFNEIGYLAECVLGFCFVKTVAAYCSKFQYFTIFSCYRFIRLGGVERQNAKKGQFKTTRNGHSMKVGCPADADILEVRKFNIHKLN